ncbi:MAG: hypothetical protein KAJ60_08790 [Desulfobulbaceae bacterium]|nr:hypothetical protein [Desulfobulbaceae bacterium]
MKRENHIQQEQVENNSSSGSSVTDRRIITDNHTLFEHYSSLTRGDVVVGRIRVRETEEYLLVDLVERGVRLIPSALSQLACRSKSLQTTLFADYMLPCTYAVHDLYELRSAMESLADQPAGKIVTKQDRKNAGQGIHLWSSLEEVFSLASLGVMPFPFVIQPFCPDSRDIRVIILGDYREAYTRVNPNNFRQNLHCGGESRSCELSASQNELCKAVMKRGNFPYAHLDLMVTETGETYLAEINLRGGLRGATIISTEYNERVAAIHDHLLAA